MHPINYQVHITGKGLHHLTHAALTELVNRHIDRQDPPRGVTIEIMVWRAGKTLDWTTDHPNAVTLRETLRRMLQSGRLSLRHRGRPRASQSRLRRRRPTEP